MMLCSSAPSLYLFLRDRRVGDRRFAQIPCNFLDLSISLVVLVVLLGRRVAAVLALTATS